MKNNNFRVGIQVVFLLLICSATSFAQNKISSRLSINKGWKFYLGDVPFPEIKGHDISYCNAKAVKDWESLLSRIKN